MENASKALIIAGAILLSILIIGLGMFIYDQAADAMGSANLDSQKIATYNAPFEQYRGTQSGSNARALYQKIQSHNRENQDDPSLQISVVIHDTPADKNSIEEPTESVEAADGGANYNGTSLNSLRAGYTYYVYFQYSKTGYITLCTITRLKA